MTIVEREMLARLRPGTVVGHANREHPDWEGVVTPDDGLRWWTEKFGMLDIRVVWRAGTSGDGGQVSPAPQWVAAKALTVKPPGAES